MGNFMKHTLFQKWNTEKNPGFVFGADRNKPAGHYKTDFTEM